MTNLRIMTVAILLLLLLGSRSLAATCEVDCAGGADYLTVQEAVDAAATGDTILIAPCTYDEEVSIIGKSLTLIGGGADATELFSGGSTPPVVFDDGLLSDGLVLVGLAVTRNPLDAAAIRWHGAQLTLAECVVTGGVGYGTMENPTASVEVTASRVSRLKVAGGMRTSTVTGSRVGEAEFAGGGFMAPGHSLYTSGSAIGELTVYDCQAHSEEDSIGEASIHGAPDVWGELHAAGSSIDHLVAYDCAATDLTACHIGTLDYFWDYYTTPDLALWGTVVSGPFVLGPGSPLVNSPPRLGHGAGRDAAGLLARHNTFLGSFDYALPASPCWCRFRSNIVLGAASFETEDCAVVTHNDFVGGVTISTPGDSVFLNFGYPPLFCNMVGGDYTLEDCSPCVGAAHDGGDVGALGVGCVCSGSDMEESSWGRIKAGYRQLSN